MTCIGNHPEQDVIRLQLKQNVVLQGLGDDDRAESSSSHLVVTDGNKGDVLVRQGAREMEQYFILDGTLKRVVANKGGREMILRFSAGGDMETSYAAWRLGTPTPYGVVCMTRARVARMPLEVWADFITARRGQEGVRVQRHERDERDHGAHDHAAPARCAGASRALPAQAAAAGRPDSAEGAGVLPEPVCRDLEPVDAWQEVVERMRLCNNVPAPQGKSTARGYLPKA